jgi:hypothetical protein
MAIFSMLPFYTRTCVHRDGMLPTATVVWGKEFHKRREDYVPKVVKYCTTMFRLILRRVKHDCSWIGSARSDSTVRQIEKTVRIDDNDVGA